MPFLRAAAIFVLLSCNLALWGGSILLLGLVKRLLPGGPIRHRTTRALVWLGERWVAGNDWAFDHVLPVEWDVEGVEGTRYEGRYLIISNHVSWVDIFALFRVFHGRAAFIRFFLKQ